MAQLKTITISIPVDVYERVETLAPRKKWGSNDVRDFYTRIFLLGMQSPEFLKSENRRLETKIKLLESLLKQQQPKVNVSAFDSTARDVEVLQDRAAKQPEVKAAPTSPPEPAAAPDATVASDKKSSIH
jgi:hypothetical protein